MCEFADVVVSSSLVVVAVVVIAGSGQWGHRIIVNNGGGVVAVTLLTAIVSETQIKANKRLTDIIKFVRWWPSSSLSNAEAGGGGSHRRCHLQATLWLGDV